MALNDGVDIAGTVRERAARELRDRILTGALPAGTRLDLDAITKEFATSRTPVREALLELSYDGLVRVAPRSAEADFRDALLGFSGNELRRMILQDKLGQTATLIFDRAERNASVSASEVSFSPPAGTDVIGVPAK